MRVMGLFSFRQPPVITGCPFFWLCFLEVSGNGSSRLIGFKFLAGRSHGRGTVVLMMIKKCHHSAIPIEISLGVGDHLAPLQLNGVCHRAIAALITLLIAVMPFNHQVFKLQRNIFPDRINL